VSLGNLERIAVLIDADNAQLVALEKMFEKISSFGRIISKKAYGDFSKPHLRKWEDSAKLHAIKLEQQINYIQGKNATDIALVIDAMDLLLSKKCDAFAIISSDSDYTPLAIRLRESGAYIFGVGDLRAPVAFQKACDRFFFVHKNKLHETIFVDICDESETSEISIVHKKFESFAEAEGEKSEDGWVRICRLRDHMKSIGMRIQGEGTLEKRIRDFIDSYPIRYELGKVKYLGKVYRVKKPDQPIEAKPAESKKEARINISTPEPIAFDPQEHEQSPSDLMLNLLIRFASDQANCDSDGWVHVSDAQSSIDNLGDILEDAGSSTLIKFIRSNTETFEIKMKQGGSVFRNKV